MNKHTKKRKKVKSDSDRWNEAVKMATENWWKSYLASIRKREALLKMVTEGPKTTYKPVFVKKRTKTS